MDTALQNKVWTDEELLSLPDDSKKCEIIKGELVVSPAGIEHEEIGVRLILALGTHVRKHKLGIVCGSSAGYWMNDRTSFLSPDVSFIAKERLQGAKRAPKKFFDGAPDLVVEVLSPSDTIDKLHEKIVEYFDNGAKLIWVLNPEEQIVLVYHTPQPDKLLRTNDALDGEDVVPEFSLPVSELFAELDF
ncbi:MAG TPA: Uma2 family endonuclease [Pyrinomonadaceae bacterium]|jgi:Uma2 family endonuclease|nr:Uma2 family endonuclease [Pyrinomonadaceae bacterium]